MEPLVIRHPSVGDIALLRPFVAQAAEAGGLDGPAARQLRLAVEEAVTNVISYGQSTVITLRAAVDGHRLVVTIDDDGVPFDPTACSATDLSVPADERPLGGLGIVLMHQLTDALHYRRADGHNILSMEKSTKATP